MASYTKLKSGGWGVKISYSTDLEPGDSVEVRKKSGEHKTEVIEKRIWHDEDVAIYTIRRGPESANGGLCAECGRWADNMYVCSDSSGIRARCCSRCAATSPEMRSFA